MPSVFAGEQIDAFAFGDYFGGFSLVVIAPLPRPIAPRFEMLSARCPVLYRSSPTFSSRRLYTATEDHDIHGLQAWEGNGE